MPRSKTERLQAMAGLVDHYTPSENMKARWNQHNTTSSLLKFAYALSGFAA